MEKNKPESDSPKACQSLIPSRAPWTAMAAWDHAVFPCGTRLPRPRTGVIFRSGRSSRAADVLRAGVKVPTGGKGRKA
ncbi:hypothetical protein ACVWXL_006373 [Bradyrhizobium sp. GM22.5]